MWLEKLILRNFRNYEYAEISFCKGTNIIQGDNAQGKTNVLEALSLLSSGKSFRTRNTCDLIKSGSSFFYIEASFYSKGVEQTLSVAFDGKIKKIIHNQTHYNNFLSLFGILPSILIVPEDINIVVGSPSERRRFLDLHMAQIDPLYVYHLGRYYKAMKQRNALFKQQSEEGMSAWEHIMAQSASYLHVQRQAHLDQINTLANRYMGILSDGKDTIDIKYVKSPSYTPADATLASLYLLHFHKMRKKEQILKTTLHGPHRDEILLLINDKEARLFGSEGQKRCLITALHLAERDMFEKEIGSSPLIGIDDFGCHLDLKRSNTLLRHTESLSQTMLTSPTQFCVQNLKENRSFKVENGTIQADPLIISSSDAPFTY